jgi:hypothetical protein
VRSYMIHRCSLWERRRDKDLRSTEQCDISNKAHGLDLAKSCGDMVDMAATIFFVDIVLLQDSLALYP